MTDCISNTEYNQLCRGDVVQDLESDEVWAVTSISDGKPILCKVRTLDDRRRFRIISKGNWRAVEGGR